MPATARLPVQLSTQAGYVEGDAADRQLTDEQLSDAYQDGDIALHELIAARKISYLPVVEQQLADLEDDTSVFTFEDDFLKQPERAIF